MGSRRIIAVQHVLPLLCTRLFRWNLSTRSVGTQGGSVINHLQRDGAFAIRALTRKPLSPRAKELAQSGIEVVYADYDNLESLIAAFRGCYGVYGVTNWFEAFENEREQGFNLVRAAKATNIQHFVLSTGEHCAPLNCPQSETKADTNDFLIASGIPRTSIYLTFYYSNMFLFDAIHKRADGALHLNLPFPTDSAIPSLAASDVGGFVLAAFLGPSKWVGQDMRLCAEYITPRQYATIFEEVSGIPVNVHEVTLDEFMQMEGNPYPSDVWSIFRWFLDGITAPFDPEAAALIYPERQTWQQFALKHVQPSVPSPSTVVVKQEYMVEQTDSWVV